MRKLRALLKALPGIKPKTLYQLLLRASSDNRPQVVVETLDHGVFSGLRNDALFQQAVETGINEPHFENLIDALLTRDSIVLDLGGNLGMHSIAMSKRVEDGHVYTFEPQSLMFSILQNNLLLNECVNVTCYRFAVSDEDHAVISMQPFNYAGERTNNGALRVDLADAMGDFALTRTLDSFDFDRLDFAKIDIQGSEVRALRGAKTLIETCRPVLFVEIEERHLRALGASTKELIELLFSMGYALFRIETVYPCDHICVPVEKVSWFEEDVRPNLEFRTSPKLSGTHVDVHFASDKDQNYQSVTVT